MVSETSLCSNLRLCTQAEHTCGYMHIVSGCILSLHASALSTSLVVTGAKQTELIALLHRMGIQHGLSAKPFSVGPTGLISVDIDVEDGSADTKSGNSQCC